MNFLRFYIKSILPNIRLIFESIFDFISVRGKKNKIVCYNSIISGFISVVKKNSKKIYPILYPICYNEPNSYIKLHDDIVGGILCLN